MRVCGGKREVCGRKPGVCARKRAACRREREVCGIHLGVSAVHVPGSTAQQEPRCVRPVPGKLQQEISGLQWTASAVQPDVGGS